MAWTNTAMLTIILEDPQQAEELPIRTLVLQEPDWTIKIGRGSQTDINLRPRFDNAWFGSRVMSREHAMLQVDPITRRVTVQDTGSMHGTFVNGTRLDYSEQHPLSGPTVITFGADIVRGELTYQALQLKVSFKWSDEDDRPIVEEWMDGLKSSSIGAPQSSQRQLADKITQNSFAVQYSDSDDEDAISDDDDVEVVFETFPHLISRQNKNLKTEEPVSLNSEHSSIGSMESEDSPPSSPAEEIQKKKIEKKIEIASADLSISVGDHAGDKTSSAEADEIPDIVFVKEQRASSTSHDEKATSDHSYDSEDESDIDHNNEAEDEENEDEDEECYSENNVEGEIVHNDKQIDVPSLQGMNRTGDMNAQASETSHNAINELTQNEPHMEDNQSPLPPLPWYQQSHIPSIRDSVFEKHWSGQYPYYEMNTPSNPYSTGYHNSTGHDWTSLPPVQYQNMVPNSINRVIATSSCDYSGADLPQVTNQYVPAKISINDILEENTHHSNNNDLKRKRKADQISSSHMEPSEDRARLGEIDIKSCTALPSTIRSSAQDFTHNLGSGQAVSEHAAAPSIDLNPIIMVSNCVDGEMPEQQYSSNTGKVSEREIGESIDIVNSQPPRKKTKLVASAGSKRRTLVKYTATALAGAAVGAISTVFGLAALPADYFL